MPYPEALVVGSI
jgi:hypothetical protein